MTTELRVATFNASLNRSISGGLIADLSTPDNAQARAVAEIIQRAAPDVVLVNEFDFDAAGSGGTSLAAELFKANYLSVGQNGASPIDYPYVYVAPSNTGIASGFDLNNNGVAVTTPGAAGYGDDALGFGAFPGQFGMVLFSKYPIDVDGVRTFQTFLWKDMPDARLPDDPTTAAPADWYSAEELDVFRLASKSHWDVPIVVEGEIVHVLAAHPTPPVFDGPEDRNGTRNADEIRFWSDYVTPGQGTYIYDDQGRTGGLAENARFVILGDYNNDPNDGDGVHQAIRGLLDNPFVDSRIVPTSPGGPEQAALQGRANANHLGYPAFDTADFADGAPGNLRADYVLPSHAGITPVSGQVFWPLASDPLFGLVGTFDPSLPGGFPSSDHRLVAMDLEIATGDRKDVTGIEFLGEVTFPTGTEFEGTEVGGLSGITYDAAAGVFYAISDDRSQIDPARFYTLTIDLSDRALDLGDVVFTDVTTLKDGSGNPFAALSLDPEGIAFTPFGLYISSEGEVKPGVRLTDPFVARFGIDGQQISALPVDGKFLPTADGSSGIRDNLAFESLTVTPNGKTLYTATENGLYQDGPAAAVGNGTATRIIQYDVATGQETAEFVYITDPVAAAPEPEGSFATNGLVDLLAIDDRGTLLAVERSFSVGVGNAIKIYQVGLQGATDVSETQAIETEIDDGALEANLDQPVRKELVLDLADLGIPLDNIEGISFGPTLAGGQPSLILVSDNNFSGTQFTQVLAFALDIAPIPTIEAAVETPAETRFVDPAIDVEGPDPDDPAIWLNPLDADQSVVVTSHKNAGLRVYDLQGHEIQSIAPEGIRYNNVDVVYGIEVGGIARDLFVASDRANDTLAIYAIDPATRQLFEVTAADVPASIFGVDDGEATSYGLDAHVAADGTAHVFVTQAGGDQVAQLKLVDSGAGKVSAELVRMLHIPGPDGVDPEDLQSEGIVVDAKTSEVYVAVESGGIYKFAVDPAAGDTMTEFVAPDADFLAPDLEGLAIRYADDGSRQLFVSSQGDATYAVLDLDTGALIGRLAIGDRAAIDGAEESDGVDIYSGPLGSAFPNGLLVVQDGSNSPQNVFPDPDDGEIQNFDANFKFVPLERALGALDIDTRPFHGFPEVSAVPRDFGGDGFSDILLQGAEGPVAIWQMHGTEVVSKARVGSDPGPSWRAVDTGDFNRDGKADILWQHADGQVGVWALDGSAILGVAAIGENLGAAWKAIATGDFNGDGETDILGQHADGRVGIALLDGTEVLLAQEIGSNPGPSWRALDTGDFDGDGASDILFQHEDGTVGIWELDGTTILAAEGVGSNPGPSWTAFGTGDFDGDGRSDIYFQHEDGTIGLWQLDGSTILSVGAIGPNPGKGWNAVSTGDFNADGRSDLVLQHTSGAVTVWTLDGTEVLAGTGAVVATADPGFLVV